MTQDHVPIDRIAANATKPLPAVVMNIIFAGLAIRHPFSDNVFLPEHQFKLQRLSQRQRLA
jgi:hypothetical protein